MSVLVCQYSGASLQGTSWRQSLFANTVEPLYKGQVGDSPCLPIQWSLSTRDKLETSPCLPIQWSLSTRDKLETSPLSPVGGSPEVCTNRGFQLVLSSEVVHRDVPLECNGN